MAEAIQQADETGMGAQPIRGRVTRLALSRFRSYRAATLEPRADLVALVGQNGAGKTNVLEASPSSPPAAA